MIQMYGNEMEMLNVRVLERGLEQVDQMMRGLRYISIYFR